MRKYYIPPDDEARLNTPGMDFRCQRCGVRGWTRDQLTIERFSGLRVCPNHTLDYNQVEMSLIFAESNAEAARLYAEYQALIASDNALYAGGRVQSLFTDMQGITGFTPALPTLHPGGAPVALVLNGVGFTDASALSIDTPEITIALPVITFGGTVLTTTLTASHVAPFGLHELRLDGYQQDIQARVLAT